MKVLVSVASKHGSTEQIGEAIALVLADEGLDVDQIPPDQVSTVSLYDAVVLGGAIYVDRWMSDVRALAERLQHELFDRAVYIFASGPAAEPEPDAKAPEDVQEIGLKIGARRVKVFAGRVDRAELGTVERAVVRMVGAQEGDYRDLDTIRQWATEVAEEIKAEVGQGQGATSTSSSGDVSH